MPDLILHHYDLSPYSEKIRLVFGIKGLAWRSVIQPMILPKPMLTPLTGGFRRTPVLQIGADVYCDTGLIACELDRRFPAPTLFPPGHDGLGWMLSLWAERALFWPTARYVTGMNSDRLPPAFHADRAAMRGHAPPTADRLEAAAPHDRVQMDIQFRWLEALLADGRDFLLAGMPGGGAPGLGDLSVYARLWWLGAFGGDRPELAHYPAIRRWMARIADFGHGARTGMPAEDALAIARSAEPDPPPGDPSRGDPSLGDPAAGDRVTVATEDHGPDPVHGTVVYCDRDRITLRREDAGLGVLDVHFPRLGYEIRPA